MNESVFVLIRCIVLSTVKGSVVGYLTFFGTRDVLFSVVLGFIYALYDVMTSIMVNDYIRKLVEKHRHASEEGDVYYKDYD